MSETPPGYHAISDEDQKKAKSLFDHGKKVADTQNFDYAIELFYNGLTVDPDNVEAHQLLRDISLRRKAGGGKALGMFAAGTLKKKYKDDKQNLINAAKLLAFDPGNTDYMVSILQNAYRGGYYDTVLWIGPILLKANADDKSPSFDKFIILKDTYRALASSEEGKLIGQAKLWRAAADSCQFATQLRPNDMDLQTELKNLGAEETMSIGGYHGAKSFRESLRDAGGQDKLHEQDKGGVKSMDMMSRQIAEAEAEFRADPLEAGKLIKLVDALDNTDDSNHETRAVELLEDAFVRTKAFRFRKRVGLIHIKQWKRYEMAKVAAVKADPSEENKKELEDFRREQTEFELEEFKLWLENYPTDATIRFDIAKRLMQLGKIDEAIPIFQQVQNDPKLRVEATLLLANGFLQSGFIDEADEVLERLIKEHPTRGDQRSKEMHYLRARALEQKNQADVALKLYSTIAQWDFNYRDVQVRMKKLRNGEKP